MCPHIPCALNAGAKRSGATCHMAMPQCRYLAKEAKRSSHTTNTIKFDRIPFDPCNSIKRFELFPFDQTILTYLQAYALFADSHFAEPHFAECMGHFADFFGKVGIEIRQSEQSSCLHLKNQTFKAIK